MHYFTHTCMCTPALVHAYAHVCAHRICMGKEQEKRTRQINDGKYLQCLTECRENEVCVCVCKFASLSKYGEMYLYESTVKPSPLK